MNATVNINAVYAKVTKSAKGQKIAYERMRAKFEAAKAELLDEFDSSPVTQEILEGPTAQTRILPDGYGNLFSFLGFSAGSTPIEPLRELLGNIRLRRTVIRQGDSWKFTVEVPSEQDIDRATPMTWESGRSWVDAVTHGLGTFSRYLYNAKEGRFSPGVSKSGTAIQVHADLRSTSQYFAGVGYVIGMLGRFKRKIVR